MATVEDRAVRAPQARQFDFWLGVWDLRWEPDGRGVNEIVSILDDHVWVDNDGQYLDFTGGLDRDRMVLERRRPDGRLQRMVWSDIQSESLHWSWERSDDDGRSWTVDWAIDYRRRTLVPAPGP